MVVEARGSVERAAATAVDCHGAGRFLSVVSLEFFQMRQQFLVVSPAVQVIADHFARSLGRPRKKGSGLFFEATYGKCAEGDVRGIEWRVWSFL